MGIGHPQDDVQVILDISLNDNANIVDQVG